MEEEITKIQVKIEDFKPENLKELEDFRIKILGRKGEITTLLEYLKEVPAIEKKNMASRLIS